MKLPKATLIYLLPNLREIANIFVLARK